MQVINVGFYPPPYGGISIHLQRLTELLVEKYPSQSIMIDISGIKKNVPHVRNMKGVRLALFLMRQKASIVHLHVFTTKILGVAFLLRMRHKVILSLHNERFLEEMRMSGVFWEKLMQFFISRMDKVIVDSEKCRTLAASFVDKGKIAVIPEFIAPRTIPPVEELQVLRLRKMHHFLLSSTAFTISFHDGEDTYGIDLLVEMMRRLVHEAQLDASIVFLLPEIGDHDYFELIRKKIEKYGLVDRFLFLTHPVPEASSLWRISDLVIRATNTDGNSLTVLEALSVGVPVLASDCTLRPEGTLLFKTRNVDDLTEKVIEILTNLGQHKEMVRQLSVLSNEETFFQLYNSLA